MYPQEKNGLVITEIEKEGDFSFLFFVLGGCRLRGGYFYLSVIPAKAGIYWLQVLRDPRLRGDYGK